MVIFRRLRRTDLPRRMAPGCDKLSADLDAAFGQSHPESVDSSSLVSQVVLPRTQCHEQRRECSVCGWAPSTTRMLRRRPAWAQPPQIVGEESAPDDQHPFVPKRSQLSPPEYVISPGPYRWGIVWRELHTDLPEQRVGLVLVTAPERVHARSDVPKCRRECMCR
jgi:hypothetical protein